MGCEIFDEGNAQHTVKTLTEPLHCKPTCLSAALFSSYISRFPIQCFLIKGQARITVRPPVIIDHLST